VLCGQLRLPLETLQKHQYDRRLAQGGPLMREITELLAAKEAELNSLTRQIDNINKEMDALRTTIRLLEQAGANKPASFESVKRPASSVRAESSQARETAVAELP
jgi:predicted  nucleic acid-binding Zn-ribbon protein